MLSLLTLFRKKCLKSHEIYSNACVQHVAWGQSYISELLACIERYLDLPHLPPTNLKLTSAEEMSVIGKLDDRRLMRRPKGLLPSLSFPPPFLSYSQLIRSGDSFARQSCVQLANQLGRGRGPNYSEVILGPKHSLGCKFVLSPPTVGRKTQIFTLILSHPESQISSLGITQFLLLGHPCVLKECTWIGCQIAVGTHSIGFVGNNSCSGLFRIGFIGNSAVGAGPDGVVVSLLVTRLRLISAEVNCWKIPCLMWRYINIQDKVVTMTNSQKS